MSESTPRRVESTPVQGSQTDKGYVPVYTTPYTTSLAPMLSNPRPWMVNKGR